MQLDVGGLWIEANGGKPWGAGGYGSLQTPVNSCVTTAAGGYNEMDVYASLHTPSIFFILHPLHRSVQERRRSRRAEPAIPREVSVFHGGFLCTGLPAPEQSLELTLESEGDAPQGNARRSRALHVHISCGSLSNVCQLGLRRWIDDIS